MEERSQTLVVRMVGFATLLLFCGMAFAYFVVLPTSMSFLLGFDAELYNRSSARVSTSRSRRS